MALVLKDRVRQTSTTSGTGTITLSGTVSGYQSFSTIGDGNTTYYTIYDATTGDWEVGIGTYTSSGTTLSRDTVLANSLGTTAKISFVGNTLDVFVTYPAGKSVNQNEAGNVVLAGSLTANTFINTASLYYNARTISTNTTLAATDSALSVGPITIADGVTVTISNGGEWSIV